MDRLTIRWEDGDEIYYALAKDPEGAYDIFSLARLTEEGDGEEAGILLDISSRLAAYEDTGLAPEEIERLKKSDASKEQSSINYYSDAKQLRSEVAALKAENERLEKDLDEALAVIKDAQGVVARWLAGAPRKEETADEQTD